MSRFLPRALQRPRVHSWCLLVRQKRRAVVYKEPDFGYLTRRAKVKKVAGFSEAEMERCACVRGGGSRWASCYCDDGVRAGARIGAGVEETRGKRARGLVTVVDRGQRGSTPARRLAQGLAPRGWYGRSDGACGLRLYDATSVVRLAETSSAGGRTPPCWLQPRQRVASYARHRTAGRVHGRIRLGAHRLGRSDAMTTPMRQWCRRRLQTPCKYGINHLK